MVLVDRSVWIRFLANRAPYAAELDRLLGLDEVTGHELVYGELLIGDRGGRRKLLAAYERMHQVAVVPHRDVVAFVRDRDLQGRCVGWIDVRLLASQLWGDRTYGRPTHDSPRWLMRLVSLITVPASKPGEMSDATHFRVRPMSSEVSVAEATGVSATSKRPGLARIWPIESQM